MTRITNSFDLNDSSCVKDNINNNISLGIKIKNVNQRKESEDQKKDNYNAYNAYNAYNTYNDDP